MGNGTETRKNVVGLMAATLAVVGSFVVGVWSLVFVAGEQYSNRGANAGMGLIAAALAFGLSAQALWRR